MYDSRPAPESVVESEFCEEGADHIEADAAEARVDKLDAVDARVADEEQSESLSLVWLLSRASECWYSIGGEARP